MKTLLILPTIFVLLVSGLAQGQAAQLKLMPMPASVQLGSGQLMVDRSFSVSIDGAKDPVLERGVQRFTARLSRETGIIFRRSAAPTNPTLRIHADHGSNPVQKLGDDESYELTVSTTGANLTAANSLGILHGLQTFLQLVETTPSGFAVPAVTIKDQPRFGWRGLLIDVGRHFIPVEVLKRNVDAMAAVKMNVLHWHLYDNEGFRIESKRFPKLQELGSDGMYYTQDELRDLVAYAHDRGIRIVPEFEMPGHSRSVIVAYPELASGPGPYKLEPDGGDPVMDPTKEETYRFIDKFIEEMTKLFPDAYYHIGGDEVNGEPWDKNPKIQEFIHAHGMKNNQDLQAYFNQRVLKILSKHHKNMIGWDEILHPELPKSIVVQSWRGQQSLAAGAKQGYNGILSSGYYLDLMWPAARHYAVDPMSDAAASLSPEEKARILGGESCMWAEWVTPENIDGRIWPRNAAIAERLWSPAEVRDPASMYERLSAVSRELAMLGLTHRSGKVDSFYRMTGTDDISALRALAEVVEPVKDYTRMGEIKGPWDFRQPLNHLVDAVDPESDAARRFQDAVQTFIQSGYRDRAAEEEIRGQLVRWRDNDAQLRRLLEKSFLLQEVAPLSQDLSILGASGLFALDYLDKGVPAPEAWKAQQLALLDQAKTAKANLLLMVVAPVQQLVEASAGKQSSVAGR